MRDAFVSGSAFLRGSLLVAVMLIAGCVGLTGHLEHPTLTVSRVELVSAQFTRQQFRVHVKIRNPNALSLPVRQVVMTLECDGEQFGTGRSVQPFVVGAQGESEFAVDLDTNLAPVLLKLMAHLKDSTRRTDYRMTGTVTTDLPMLRSVPFEVRGSFPEQPR